MNTIAGVALRCLDLSLSPLPIRPKSKKPSVPSWGAYRNLRMTAKEVNNLFSEANNVALIAGSISGNLECLDFDRADLFLPFFKRIASECPELKEKLQVWQETPSGGYHLIYRCSGPVGGNTKLARSEKYTGDKRQIRQDTWIETRGEGGYFLIAPSKCSTQKSPQNNQCTPYVLHGNLEDIPKISMEERKVLHSTARLFDKGSTLLTGSTSIAITQSANNEKPGEWFNRITDWKNLLQGYGWVPIQMVNNREHWQRPGKSGNETSATLNGQGLYVFSTSTPLPTEKPLDQFAVYTWYEHHGDFKSAAKQLSKLRKQNDSPVVPQTEEQEFDIKPWPKLPGNALHGVAGAFTELACQGSEADPAAVLATFLVRFGVECGSSPTFLVGDSKHHARLASVIVGASSRGRKGTSSKPVERLFRELENPAQSSPGPFSSGEGIIWAVRDEISRWNEKGQKWTVIDPGIEDKRLFVLDEEFAGVLANTKREGNTLSMIIRNAWDNGNLDPLTKTNKISATGAHIGWVSHVSLDELHRKLDTSEAFNGFANRILWVCAKRSKLVPFPDPMPESEIILIRQHLNESLSLIKNATSPLIVSWSNEARLAWGNKHYSTLSKDNPGLVGSIINRAEAQVLRLAVIYSLLDKKNIIELAHLQAALSFWSYCEQSARYIFKDRKIDKIGHQIVSALGSGPKTSTELFKLFHNHIKKEKIESVISGLIASGAVKRDVHKTKGRPKTVWTLSKCEKRELSETSNYKTGQFTEITSKNKAENISLSHERKGEKSEKSHLSQQAVAEKELNSHFFRLNSPKKENLTIPILQEDKTEI